MTKKTINLNFGYILEVDSNVFIRTPEGKLKIVPAADPSVTFYINAKGKSQQEAEKLVEQGKAKKYTAKELYYLAFPDEEEFYKRFYGLSKKLYDWLTFQRKIRGYFKSKLLFEIPKDAKFLYSFHNPFSLADAEVYQLPDKTYCIQFPVVCCDDVDIRTWIFKTKPTLQVFHDLLNLEELEAKIRFFHYPETFICWECGKKTHFVEINAKSLSEKISFYEDKYCGC